MLSRFVVASMLGLTIWAYVPYDRELPAAFPTIPRRIVTNCSNDCVYCANAVRAEWRPVAQSVSTYITESTGITILADGSMKTNVVPVAVPPDVASDYDSYASLYSEGAEVQAWEIRDGFFISYPTTYILFPDEYAWKGTLYTDGTCSQVGETSQEVDGPTAQSVKAPISIPIGSAAFSTIGSSVVDSLGWYFIPTLVGRFADASLSQYLTNAAFQSCEANCDGLVVPGVVIQISGTINLNALFVRVCTATGHDGKSYGCADVTNAHVQAGSGGFEDRSTVTSGGSVYITAGEDGGGTATTIVRPDGATAVVQGGTLVTPAPGATGAAGGAGITITDERGSIMVIQGGVTGTLTAGPGGSGTALVVGTFTQTAWVPGDSIPGARGDAEPTAQGGACGLDVPVAAVGVGVTLAAVVGVAGLL